MDEIWERAVETALDGQSDHSAVRNLTLDGAVKCVQGRLPRPDLLERFRNLEHLSIASIGVSSLEQFPRLGNLKKLILSDNRIAGGLEFLVLAGLNSLRDLDLSNNRIQFVEDLVPLSQLKLVSLDLYECPVTRVKDYRSRVFGLIKSLKYLDKIDAEENERPESDEEDDDDDDDEEEEEEEEEDDPGSCEVDCEDRQTRTSNGHSERMGDVVEVDGEEEGEADEEETETETGRQVNGVIHHQANGFRVEHLNEDDEDDEDDDDDEFGEEEIDEEDGEENDDVVEVHEIEDSDDDGDGDDDEIEDDEDDEEEEVDNDEVDFRVPECNGLLTSTDGEIDGHEQGEDDDGEGDGETEEEQGVEDAEEEDEDYEARYLVLPVAQTLEEYDGEDDEEIEDDNVEDEEDDDDAVPVICPPSSSLYKRKRDADDDEEEEEDDIDVDNESSSGEDDDNGSSADDDEINR